MLLGTDVITRPVWPRSCSMLLGRVWIFPCEATRVLACPGVLSTCTAICCTRQSTYALAVRAAVRRSLGQRLLIFPVTSLAPLSHHQLVVTSHGWLRSIVQCLRRRRTAPAPLAKPTPTLGGKHKHARVVQSRRRRREPP